MKRIPAAILALLMLLSAALADGAVPTDTFAALPGFVQQDPGRVQLCVYVHNPETWRAGATIEPEPFFLNVDEPAGLLGDASMDRQDAVQKYNVISLGLHLYRPDADAAGHWDLVASPKGTKGVFIEDALVEAGPGFDVLMDRAEEALGYRPGDMDFLGKKSVRATLEWTNNARSTADPETLRRLDGILNGADFTIGSVNCPSPCFLTMEYEDGSSASIAVATNSFTTFFYRGVCFDTARENCLLKLFHIAETPESYDSFRAS